MKVLLNTSVLGIIRASRINNLVISRPFKNFGHKRQPVPLVTTIWHGFLTFSFIGLVLKWEKMKVFLFGDSESYISDTIESSDQF